MLADYLEKPQDESSKHTSKKEEIRHHVQALTAALERLRAQDWEMSLDSEDFSGRYLVWEAMNIRSVGPVLPSAPHAETDDGEFDFVAIRENERAILENFLTARATGEEIEFPFTVRRFKRMELWWEDFSLHLDDCVWPDSRNSSPKPSEITLEVKPSALLIWR